MGKGWGMTTPSFGHGAQVSHGALAAALLVAASGPSPAGAQTIAPRVSPTEAAQGTFTSATAGFQSRSGTLDVVQVRGDSVLTWSTFDTQPNGGAFGNAHVDFLPQGTELRFEGTGGAFTAINRVLTVPDRGGAYRPIAVQGRVTSFLSPGGARGGDVWFYSPGGILATGTAAFNVGSLVLSASDITSFARTNFARTADFVGAASPTSRVTLQAGASVNLPDERSSLVIFAPSIEQGGSVAVNGSVTYASAVAGGLSLANDGSVRVTVTTQAPAGNEIRHTGTTTGPATTATLNLAIFDPHVVEFLSGDDIGVLLSGAIGYAPATDANLMPNGSIQLTAGPVTVGGGLTLSSDIAITSASPLVMTAGAGETIRAGSDIDGGYRLTVTAPGATLTAAAGGVIDLDGDLLVSDPMRNAAFVLTTEAAAGGQPGGRLRIGGRAVLDAVGGGPATGTIAIRDRTTDAGAGMQFGRLVADALAASPGASPTLTVETAGNTILVDQAAELSGDGIAFAFTGGSGLRAGTLLLDAGPGGIALGRTGGVGLATLEALGQVDGYALGDIVGDTGTRLVAGAGLSLRSAEGGIALANLASNGSAEITAARDVRLGNAAVAADPASPGSLTVRAGYHGIALAYSYDPEAIVDLSGTVTTQGALLVEAGGFARFLTGSAVEAGEGIVVRTGDDSLVESGASLISRRDPAFGDGIALLAGDINFGPNVGDLSGPITTPIASLRVFGTLDSLGGGGVLLTGDAVDATGSIIRSGALTVDVTDTPFFGPFSSDAGLLRAACTQGSACLGAVAASGDVLIGLNSPGDLISLTLGSLDMTGDVFGVQVREGMELGTAGVPSLVSAGASVALSTLFGDIRLADISLQAPFVDLSAGLGSLLGNGTLLSSNDIVVDVGSSLEAARIATGGRLVRSLSGGGPYLLDGDFRVGAFETGALEDIAVTAGGDVAIGFADPRGRAIVLRGSNVELLTNAANTAAIDLQGATIRFNALQALGTVTLEATGGDILGDAPGAVNANIIDLAATGAITTGALTAETDIALAAGGALTLGLLDAGRDISLDGATLAADTLRAGGRIDAAITGAATIGALSSGGDTALLAATLDLGDGAVGGRFDARTTGGRLSFDTVAAATVLVDSAGDIGFAALDSGGAATVRAGGKVTGGVLTSDGLADVSADGGVVLTGLVAPDARLRSSGGVIDARGVAVGGLVDAQGTAVTLAAPGRMRALVRATAGDVAITAGGDLAVDNAATGAAALTSAGGNVAVGDAQAGGRLDIAAAQDIVIARTALAGEALLLDAGRLVTIAGAASGQTIDLRAADLAIDTGATLGAPTTRRITLTSPATIDLGAGASGGFALDQAEFDRIRSGGDLFIEALAGASGGVLNVTGGLTVVSGVQIGADGTFGLTATNGPLTVRGALGIAKAGVGNTLALTGDTVDLDYATAALAVVDAADVPTGRITITGRIITSISDAARADIVGKTVPEISLRLGIADVNRATSLFRARNLFLNGIDAILIQNSGPGAAIDDRRGINVGALTVTGAADGHTVVVINGEVAAQSGANAAKVVSFTTPVVQGSTVNGCVLGNIDACGGVPVIAPAAILFETAALIEDDEEAGENSEGVDDGDGDGPAIDTHLVDDPAGRPMIDDPVTGAGNEDLWQVPEPAPQGPQG